MEIIIGLLVIIAFLIYNFTKDMKQKNAELVTQGGIKQKYKKLISHFDEFDYTQLPTVLNNDVNFYQIGWAGATTLASVSFIEIADKINIEFIMDYNVPGLKRQGVDVSKLPNIKKQKTWSHSKDMDQSTIYYLVAQEIQFLCNI